MLRKLVDYFVPKNKENAEVEIWRLQAMSAFFLLLAFATFLMWMTVVFGFMNDHFPAFTAFLITVILLFYYRKTGNGVMAMNVFIMMVFVGNAYNVMNTGGIYSFNLRWFIIPTLVGILILSFRNALFWLLLSVSIVSYFYFTHTEEQFVDKLAFSAEEYFIDNVFFFMLTCIVLNLLYGIQATYNAELNSKNALLEDQKISLESQSEQLKDLSIKLKKSNENLETYAHSTAHDLKQPVRTIAGLAKVIQDDFERDQVDEKTRKSLSFVLKASNKLSNLIEDLLNLAKVNHQKATAFQSFNPNMAIEDIKNELAIQIGQSNFNLIVPELPIIEGIPMQLERVFQNLISNALKYKRDDVDSELEIRSFEKSDHFLFRFTDNGQGIPEDQTDGVFHAFSQAHSEGEKVQEGIGFGLSICRKIVQDHGGHIWVESEFGQGSTFYFTIPKEPHFAYSQAS